MMSAEIIAHRGASRERPENTLEAFLRAVELGAHGIELDVHAMRDGHVVVHHDPTYGKQRAALAEITLEDLDLLRPTGGPGVPTLRQVLDEVAPHVHLYVEIKGHGIARQVVELLRSNPERSSVHSFDHRVSREVKAIQPGIRTGILSSSYVMDPAGSLKAADADDYWQHYELCDQELVTAIHESGGRVVCWTVDDPARVRALTSMGVDGICADAPDAAIAALAGQVS